MFRKGWDVDKLRQTIYAGNNNTYCFRLVPYHNDSEADTPMYEVDDNHCFIGCFLVGVPTIKRATMLDGKEIYVEEPLYESLQSVDLVLAANPELWERMPFDSIDQLSILQAAHDNRDFRTPYEALEDFIILELQ